MTRVAAAVAAVLTTVALELVVLALTARVRRIRCSTTILLGALVSGSRLAAVLLQAVVVERVRGKVVMQMASAAGVAGKSVGTEAQVAVAAALS